MGIVRAAELVKLITRRVTGPAGIAAVAVVIVSLSAANEATAVTVPEGDTKDTVGVTPVVNTKPGSVTKIW